MNPNPITPDGRYFVVRGRLWRCSDPALSAEQKRHWTTALMQARRAKGSAMRAGNREAREQARRQIEEAKEALGERGKPWWTDGAPDLNRRLAKNTPYAKWFASIGSGA